MRHAKTSWLWWLIALAGGCGGLEVDALPQASRRARADRPAGSTGAVLARPEAQAPPSHLTCVSNASVTDGETVPQVWRVEVQIRDREATLSLARGPQFTAHRGASAPAAPTPDVSSARVTLGRHVFIHHEGTHGITLTLDRQGLFFTGTLFEDECYLHREEAVICWNHSEVLGSPWSGAPGAFAAHVDHQTGRCLDAERHEVLNQVPIEFIRETAYGECADLSGVSLNGDDFSEPELFGWYLPGAVLDGATLHFAHLTSATLDGARLGKLEMGYATVQGSTDRFTELPAGATCSVTQSPWAGSTTTCLE